MTLQPKVTVRLFDQYSLVIPRSLKYYEDGPVGKRVMFITDRKETFTVSFEEGMQLMDMCPDTENSLSGVSFQERRDDKYIHIRRGDSGAYIFFHMELKNEDGDTQYLPGQMMVTPDYKWAHGIEPVLMELLEGLQVSKTKDGR